MSDEEEQNAKIVRDICQPFVLDDETLRKIMDLFQNELSMGLCKLNNFKAVVKCWVTYVQSLPTGCETGKYLALDLGGTNFRVLCIYLNGDQDFRMESDIYEIPTELLVGQGKDLFDHIVDCLAKFIKNLGMEQEKSLPLGFTFSFPVKQNGLTKGTLVSWTKGFNCSGVVGEDVVDLLTEAMKRRGISNVGVTALLNDTTGTLMSCAWKNPYCKIGLIVGTGSNSCYLEKIKNLNTFEPDPSNKVPTMIINCESGAFGDNGTLEFVRTKYDREVNSISPNRDKQLFEKMISGMYLGELARRIMLDCCKDGALFNGRESSQLSTENTFSTENLSVIVEEEQKTKAILQGIGYTDVTDADCENVRYICECVIRRSAHLVSTTMACLINRIGDPYLVIGVDGSVYRCNPQYHILMTQKIKCLARPEHKFDIMLSEDGSGRGAALVAAVAASLESKKSDNEKRKSTLQP